MAAGSSGASYLLRLPAELLWQVPSYLDNIEDLLALGASCSKLRSAVSRASPSTVLRLAAASTRIFFQPSPHLLVAASAPSLRRWVVGDAARVTVLRTALQGGMDGLFELCIQHGELTLARIRELHEYRFSTINPVVDLVDRCVGLQWQQTPNFWDGGCSDAETLSVESSETFFQLAIYGDLFGGVEEFEDFLKHAESSNRRPFAPSIPVLARLDYVKYCMPDWACHGCQHHAGPRDPLREVLDTAAYAQSESLRETWQIGMLHLLSSRKWREAWKAVRDVAGGEVGDDGWRQELWENVVVMSGLAGMEMLRPGGALKWQARLQQWRQRILALALPPERVRYARHETWVLPCLQGDLKICTSGYWG